MRRKGYCGTAPQLGTLVFQCGELEKLIGELEKQIADLEGEQRRGLRGRGLFAAKRAEIGDECGVWGLSCGEKADGDAGCLRLQAHEVAVEFARTGETHFPRYLLLALLAVFGGDVEELGDFLVAEVDADQGEVAEFARRQCGVGIDEAHEEGNVHLLEIGGEIAPFFR